VPLPQPAGRGGDNRRTSEHMSATVVTESALSPLRRSRSRAHRVPSRCYECPLTRSNEDGSSLRQFGAFDATLQLGLQRLERDVLEDGGILHGGGGGHSREERRGTRRTREGRGE
jgi:hypothetical protein